MPTVREIEKSLFELAPRSGAMEWDNVGLLVGDPEASVDRILVALDVTELEAKQDVLFEKLQAMGVLNIAIGDLGNEIGMGTIADHIKKYMLLS